MATDTNTLQPPPPPPPGLINSAPGGGQPEVASYNPAQAQASQAQTSTYTPEGFTVTPNQTVQGQIESIIKSGSPLMEQAEANARRMMNARGLINSTAGVNAGQTAVLSAALPIAQSDAATYERAATNTTQAKNVALGAEAQAKNVAGLQDASLATQTSQFNAGSSNTAMQAAANASNTKAIQAMNNESAQRIQQMVNDASLRNIMEQGKVQERLLAIEGKNKAALQTSAGAAQLYNQMVANVAQIIQNQDLDWDSKMTAMNNLVEGIDGALEAMTQIGNIPGIDSTLKFGDDQWR